MMNIKKIALSLLVGTTLFSGGFFISHPNSVHADPNVSESTAQGRVVVQYVNALTGQPIRSSKVIYGAPNSMLDLSNDVPNIPGYVAGSNRADNGGNTYPAGGKSMTVTIAYQPLNQAGQTGNWQGGNATTPENNAKSNPQTSNTNDRAKTNGDDNNSGKQGNASQGKADSTDKQVNQNQPNQQNKKQDNSKNQANQESQKQQNNQKQSKQDKQAKKDDRTKKSAKRDHTPWMIGGIIVILIVGIGAFVWYRVRKAHHFRH